MPPPNDSPYTTPPAPVIPAPTLPDPGPGQPVTSPAPSEPTGTPTAPPNGDSTPTATLTDAQAIQSGIEAALVPIQTELTALREENATLRDLQSNPPAPIPEPTSEGDFTQELLTDPRGAVTGIVKEVVGQLAPLLNEISGTANEAIVESHRGIIDNEFGDNTFQEEIMPILSKRFDVARKENPALLASREWINNEVNGIKGFKLNALVDRRGKATTDRAAAAKAETERMLTEFNATNLTGGNRGASNKSREPTPDEQAYIASCANQGHTVDVGTLRKSQEAGNTLTGLQEAFKQEDK